MKMTNAELAAILAILSHGASAPKGREMGPDVDAKVASWLSRAVTDELNMYMGILDEIEAFSNAPANADYIGLGHRLNIVAEAMSLIGHARFGPQVMNKFVAEHAPEDMKRPKEEQALSAEDIMRVLFR